MCRPELDVKKGIIHDLNKALDGYIELYKQEEVGPDLKHHDQATKWIAVMKGWIQGNE